MCKGSYVMVDFRFEGELGEKNNLVESARGGDDDGERRWRNHG